MLVSLKNMFHTKLVQKICLYVIKYLLKVKVKVTETRNWLRMCICFLMFKVFDPKYFVILDCT